MASLPSLGDEKSDLYKRFENSLSTGTKQVLHDFSWMTPQMRTELIEYANAKIHDPAKTDFVPPKEVLFWLGDTNVLKERVEAYRKADGATNIEGPPDVLPYLIDDLSHASSENHIGVPGKLSLMDTSVVSAYDIINQWPAFPAATRAWAQRLGYNFGIYGSGPNARENRLLREWWEHNKVAVLSGQYSNATWLPPQG